MPSRLVAGMAFVAILASSWLLLSPLANASYHAANLIDNYVFLNESVMDSSHIQSFLDDKGSYLRNHSFTENCDFTYMSSYMHAHFSHCGTPQRAAVLINDAAKVYGISPRVIMATLQKEQSLITDSTPSNSQLNCAMGYQSCDSSHLGFFKQVVWGAFQLRLNFARSNGDNSWNKSDISPSPTYACPSKTSTHSTGLYPGRTVTFYNPGGSARTITIANAATASLYCYTPYVGPYSETGYSGSYNFVVSYEDWWGSTHASPVKVVIYDGRSDESGAIAKIGVSLIEQPSANVTIPFTVSDGSEASFSSNGGNPPVTSTNLTITPSNYNKPTVNVVRVYGRNDALHDGDISYKLVGHEPNSSDETFGSLSSNDVPDVTLYNDDNESDIPLSGDFDHNKKDTISLRRGNMMLINNGLDGHTEYTFRYGDASYNDGANNAILAGDWNGDGKTTFAFKVGNLYMINNENDGNTNYSYHYGDGSETPLVGDWNGDGHDTISLRKNHTNYINNGLDGHTELTYSYGQDNDWPLAGDFDHNGRDSISLRHSGSNVFYMNNVLDGKTDYTFAYGTGSETPIVGDWNGDNRDTISLRVPPSFRINNSFDGHSDFSYNYGR